MLGKPIVLWLQLFKKVIVLAHALTLDFGGLLHKIDTIAFVLNNVLGIHERIAALNGKIRAKLALSKKQLKELSKRLKDINCVYGVQLVNRKKVDHVQPMGDSIEEINMKSEVGEYLFQSDIVLTRAQAEEIVEDINNDGTNRTKRQAFRDWRYPKTTWGYGVAYVFDENASKPLMKLKDASTLLHFSIFDLFVCKIKLRDQPREDLIKVGVAAHELGHALGFLHTHARHDRDQYITVNIRNVKPDLVSLLDLETSATNENYGVTYDPGSVMHYGSTSVSFNHQPAIVPKDVKYIETLGSPFISFYDLLMLNIHYNCTAVCDPSHSAQCKMGGFPHPRDCKKCVCPGGYDGQFCDERPAGCGEELQAASDYQYFTTTVGDKKSRTPREDYDKCHFWIKAPAGKKIEVKLTQFSPPGIAVDGCIYSGIEIKTQKDQGLTGYRLCSMDDIKYVFISESNLVPFIVYDRLYGTDVTVQYRFF
ncbi:unnamed protein product [Heligmosomoides polygyrus]|uniref:Zinc metalloproteinase n=1 Tax=Heligmosomoides polygyrus TaxID=6339 RepID=A0A183GAZ8_HELPZ|nr:unnamed protein product [Heligmosomoides polygyrus]